MTQAKSILITGCSSGIGYDAALTLHQRGWRVFATCRTPEDRDRLSGLGPTTLLMDYADTASIHAAVGEVLEATGGTLDAVYNNGAFGIPGAVEDLPTDALRSIFEANVFGYHELTRLVLPVMRAQGYGRIVNCSSVLGFVVAPWRGAYNATKHALEALTSTLRIEMRDTPIHIITLQPGPITSRIRQNSIKHFERWIDWQASPRVDDYKARLLKRLYDERGPDPFELPPSAVTAKLIRALETDNPKPRYMVTTPTYLMDILVRLLPKRMLEAIIAKG